MARRGYWRGFTTGAMIGAGAATGALLFTNLWGRAGRSRIIRLEKSLQIGRPVEEVFQAWQHFERLPAFSPHVLEVRRSGDCSHWRVQVDGRELEWDAQIEQLVPNQAIGWKSIRGPKHTGRISFSPLGRDTLVHVTMNYAPPSRFLRPFLAPVSGDLEGYVEAVLRDFKAGLENRESRGEGQSGPRAYPAGTTTERAQATGTFGAVPPNPAQTSELPQSQRFGDNANPVEFTAPPEAKR